MALQKYDARKTSEKHPDFQPLEYFFEKMKVNTNHLWWHTETIWPLTFLCSPHSQYFCTWTVSGHFGSRGKILITPCG